MFKILDQAFKALFINDLEVTWMESKPSVTNTMAKVGGLYQVSESKMSYIVELIR